ncbi:hypothetical protein GH714_011137 [Hevea brasiliensis]|uniref:SnoaL-like domain-containing protein n=1 Tax=Hevea brasiliensis TaxID=3981 RepID=A0A6A6MKH1_HEVBR|nr:hypothetical protein GH714_011137 [Hevea brasiliensis]
MLEDLFVDPGETSPSKLPKPDATAIPPLKSELDVIDEKRNGKVQNGADSATMGTEKTDDSQQLHATTTKETVTISKIPNPATEVKQQPISRMPGDAVLKILLQKVRSLELNLSVLEEFIKEMNRRQGDILPDLEKELSRVSFLLEKSKAEINDLVEWKENMDKGLSDLESWKATVSSRMDALVRENIMLRLDVEKVVNDQANLESKELAVLAMSLFFMCFATIKLVSARVMKILGASQSDKAANDDNAWKALYHKDFTLEQDTVTPVNGWKAYYAATRAIVNANTEFYNIIKKGPFPQCVDFGLMPIMYNAVMQSWQLAFNWDQGLDFQVRDVRARVLTDMAWVTMKTYVHMDTGPFTVTNVFEFHNGRWYMVHHHNSVMLDGDVDQQILHAF